MNYTIIPVGSDQLEEAFALVKRVFLAVDAADYSKEGIDAVMDDMIENAAFKGLFETGEQKMFGAVMNGTLIGVAAIGPTYHVSLFFVDSQYHRKGVASALFDRLVSYLKSQNAEAATLNSTPYAVPFYQKVGFAVTGPKVEKHGVFYTPMKYTV